MFQQSIIVLLVEMQTGVISTPKSTEEHVCDTACEKKKEEKEKEQEEKKSEVKMYIEDMSTKQLLEWVSNGDGIEHEKDNFEQISKWKRVLCDIVSRNEWNGEVLCNLLVLPSAQTKNDVTSLLNSFEKDSKALVWLIKRLKQMTANDVSCTFAVSHRRPLDELQAIENAIATYEARDPCNASVDSNDDEYIVKMWKQLLLYFDRNGDGTLNEVELGDALRALGIDKNEEQLKQFMGQLDTDNSGQIDFHEFQFFYRQFFQEKIKHGFHWQTLQTIFELFDTNVSGYLNYSQFIAAIRKMCPHLEEDDINHILCIADSNSNGHIDFDEFTNCNHKKRSNVVVRRLLRGQIDPLQEYFEAFEGMPKHFRKSMLAEIAKNQTDGLQYMASGRLKPQPSADENNNLIARKQTQIANQANCKQFTITDCSGVPIPSLLARERILARQIRVCLWDKNTNKPASNVLTMPASWRREEEDQWIVNGKVWKSSVASSTVTRWNSFLVKLDNDKPLELLFELCIIVASPRFVSQNNQDQSELESNKVMEMSCGWTVLPIPPLSAADHSNNLTSTINKDAVSKGSTKGAVTASLKSCVHKLQIRGGSYRALANITNEALHRGTTKSQLHSKECNTHSHGNGISFRKLGHLLLHKDIASVLKVTENHYDAIKPSRMRSFVPWLPNHMLINFLSIRIIKLFTEILADDLLRSQEYLQNPWNACNRSLLHVHIFNKIIDDPNLLCCFIDQWNTIRRHQIPLQQRKDAVENKTNDIVKIKFRELLIKFMPIILHQLHSDNPLQSLNQQRLVCLFFCQLFSFCECLLYQLCWIGLDKRNACKQYRKHSLWKTILTGCRISICSVHDRLSLIISLVELSIASYKVNHYRCHLYFILFFTLFIIPLFTRAISLLQFILVDICQLTATYFITTQTTKKY
ncbi:hypothetical protein RFI_21137 [Reticulomyxa filosa]|uniref:Calmodulin n=1 Tax=Reticulomyxa filosa TaxID=46433 RepID=X6MQS9_RETFI|nr:hypothetical protein RFI_21137 [Reticulomyxa filosa]|eukprot:ETO16219.1 hypothetical protein RFI_21137 [Reticulomyxa filosa]